MIDFIVLKSKEKFRCPINDSSVYEIESLSDINNLKLKKENLSVICESEDLFSEEYVNSAISIFNEFPNVGCVYSNYLTSQGYEIYVPSFCRQRLVLGLYVPPVNCVVRNSILNRLHILGNSPMELFLKISDTFAIYHVPDFFYTKSKIYNYIMSENDLRIINELFNSNS